MTRSFSPGHVPGEDVAAYAVGRGLLSDPNWANKVESGDLDSLLAFEAASLSTLY